MKIVLDTNTLISALGWQGKPQDILNHCINGACTLVISPEILKEVKEVLFRRTFEFIESSKKEELIMLLSRIAQVIIPTHKASICRDKDDNKFVELALSSNTKYIISGDEDLLSIKEYSGIKILSPDEFMSILQNS